MREPVPTSDEDMILFPENTIEKMTDTGIEYTLSNSYDSCSIISSLTSPDFAYSTDSYSDISTSEYRDEILKFSELGVIHGYDDGTFGAQIDISRTEFLKVVLKSHCLNYDEQDASLLTYIDIDTNTWQARVIAKAQEL